MPKKNEVWRSFAFQQFSAGPRPRAPTPLRPVRCPSLTHRCVESRSAHDDLVTSRVIDRIFQSRTPHRSARAR